MRDLIDRSAIKLPPHFFEDVDNVPKFYEWLNSLPTASPWHRVEEPPKENGRYLVSWEGVVTTDEYKNGVWLYASMFNQLITHWMPLPEPPKEGIDGNRKR